jgi:hypothetical protein
MIVDRETIVLGSVNNLGPSGHIWLFVKVDGLYFPQSGPLLVLPSGEWTGKVFIGGLEDTGKAFNLMLVESGENATIDFADFLRSGGETGTFPGLTVLPPDVKILDSQTVVRSARS